MRHLKSYLERVSNEDADNQEPVVVEPVSETVPEANDAVEAETLVEEEPSADAIKAEIEEVSDIQESLENFSVLVDAAFARGGLRPEEGVMFQTSLEHFHRRLGIVQSKLGMEDFGGNMSRMKATTVSQEDLKETTKAAIAKIKALIAKLIEFIMNKTGRLEAQSKKVTAVLANLKTQVKTIVTGEVELEFDRNTRLNAEDIELVVALDNSALWGILLCQKVGSTISKTVVAAKRLAEGPGEEADIEEFNKTVNDLWYVGNSPVENAFSSGGVRKLSTCAKAKMTKAEAGKNPVLSHRIAVETTDVSPIKLTINKTKYASILADTEKFNSRTLLLLSTYTSCAESLKKLDAVRNVNSNEALSVLIRLVEAVAQIVENDVNSVVEYVSKAQAELGYVCAMLGQRFGK